MELGKWNFGTISCCRLLKIFVIFEGNVSAICRFRTSIFVQLPIKIIIFTNTNWNLFIIFIELNRPWRTTAILILHLHFSLLKLFLCIPWSLLSISSYLKLFLSNPLCYFFVKSSYTQYFHLFLGHPLSFSFLLLFATVSFSAFFPFQFLS